MQSLPIAVTLSGVIRSGVIHFADTRFGVTRCADTRSAGTPSDSVSGQMTAALNGAAVWLIALHGVRACC